jgi:hypothetical protein
MLYSVTDISENTKKTMWKYLQLILITIMSSIESSASFGDAASIFEGIDEHELQTKLSETIEGLSDFFKGITKEGGLDADGEHDPMMNPEEFAKNMAESFDFETPDFESTPEMKEAFEKMFNGNSNDEKRQSFNFDGADMPNVDELHGHIKGLFDGKIGSLAKELAEELSGDVMEMFDDGAGQVKSTGDILKNMMKNPKQIMELVKKISTKLDNKMKSGNISQEELMKEAGDLLSKMKGMGNGKDFQDMMQNMMKNMGPMMGMMGKNAKMDMNKMNTMISKNTHKERMLKKLEQKRLQTQGQQQTNYILEKTKNPNELVFKGEDQQEKSFAKPLSTTIPSNDDWLDEPVTQSIPKKSKKNGKNKKK